MISLQLYSKKYKSFVQMIYGAAFNKLTNAKIYGVLSFFHLFKSSLYICINNENIQIGGAAILRKFNHHTLKMETWVAGVHVLDQYRRQNYGTKIMHSLLDICKNKGFYNINLYVDKNNYNAYKLYDKLGFEVIGTYKQYLKMNYTIKMER